LIVRPARVLVLPMGLTMTARLTSGLPRQFSVIGKIILRQILRSIELVKASSERRLVEVMHQALKALVRVARRQPGSPLQFRVRL
jgi:hypothetical protein